MNFRNLFISIVAATLLGITTLASADVEPAIEEENAKMAEANEQATTDKPVAKSGTEMAVHVATNADELAKKLANPIAAMISVPFQYNYSRTYRDNGFKIF